MSISSLRGIVSRVMPHRKPHAPAVTAARIDYAKDAETAEEKATAFQRAPRARTQPGSASTCYWMLIRLSRLASSLAATRRTVSWARLS